MYSDTKRSISQVVESHVDERDPRLSSLYIALSVQKDRLFAWGLQWADNHRADARDIDVSLSQAGISEVVESIMDTINKHLDEAESLRKPITGSSVSPSPLGSSKDLGLGQSTTAKVVIRLEQIISTITTSVDTLCDLSRARDVATTSFSRDSSSTNPGLGASTSSAPPLPLAKPSVDVPPFNADPAALQIDIADLHFIDEHRPQGSAPPSYESLTLGRRGPAIARMGSENVFIDYRPTVDIKGSGQDSLRHSLELAAAIQPTSSNHQETYVATLKIQGWFNDKANDRHGFVFKCPDSFESIGNRPLSDSQVLKSGSLRSFLQSSADIESDNVPALEDRFKLAYNLALCLARFHRNGVLHRNLTSEGVVFFSPHESHKGDVKIWKEGIIRKPFVIATDTSENNRFLSGEGSTPPDIYQHPRITRLTRQTRRPSHDYYSLGLILLEIGLWMPLHKLWKPRYTRLDFKHRIEAVYVKRLISKCGRTYTRIIEYCLQAADQNYTTSAGRCLENFLQRVVEPLGRCCMMDDSEAPIFTFTRDTEYTADITGPMESAIQEKQSITEAKDGKSPEKDPETESRNENPQQFQDSQQFQNIEPPQELEQPQRIAKSQSTEQFQSTKQSQSVHRSQSINKKQVSYNARRRHWVQPIDIPAEYRKHWELRMLPQLRRALPKIIDRWESYSIDLLMLGETPETAKPTIYMVCDSTRNAKKALYYVNRDEKLFDIMVVKGQIERSKARKKRRPPKRKDTTCTEDVSESIHKAYQLRPACGASIGAYMDDQHLPPVSLGGTILVNDQPFAISVHHMLENDDVDMGLEFNLERSMVHYDDFIPDWSSGGTPAENLFEVSGDEDDGYEASYSDLSEAGDWFEGSVGSDDDGDMGDTPGYSPDAPHDIIVTQPAIDDVAENFFPDSDEAKEEHLLSHKLGRLHASSGIKRLTRDGITHEVDWALIQIDESRSDPKNIIRGGGAFSNARSRTGNQQRESSASHEQNDLHSFPRSIKPTENLGGLAVHGLGRTSGLRGGKILPAMTLVKMPGRVTNSLSWTVIGGFGMGGDSGAWVVDNATHAVCAHVLAWSERNAAAYISPMEILLDDISQTLDAQVSLPGTGTISTTQRNEAMPAIDAKQSDESAIRSSALARSSPTIKMMAPPVPKRYSSPRSFLHDSHESSQALMC